MSKEDGTPSVIRENIKYLKRENTLKHIHRFVINAVTVQIQNIVSHKNIKRI